MIIYKLNDNEQIEFIPIANYHQGPIKGGQPMEFNSMCYKIYTDHKKRD